MATIIDLTDETSSPPGAEQVWAQLGRLLADPALKASARRREFLRFVVEETLAGRAEQLKSFTIANAVFGRDANFDQQSDPVVRIEARRLRRDLDSYYIGAGRDEPGRISIPTGGYVPQFLWQGPTATVAAPTPDGPPAPADEEPGMPNPGPAVRQPRKLVRRNARLRLAGAEPRRRLCGHPNDLFLPTR